MKFQKSPLDDISFSNTKPFPSSPFQVKENQKLPLLLSDNGLCFRYRIIKRTLDIFLAGFFLIFIMSWLIPLLAFINWLDGNVPVFFVQKRVGFNNRFFYCYKLRTIRKNKKITRWSYFIRCNKLDELPQFINVLKGEMSFVGPRPHMLSDHKAFSKVIGKEYFDRHKVLPGITGLAQINGFDGRITTLEKLQGRVNCDLTYIQEWSIWLDLKIIVKTVGFIFKGLFKKTK